MPAAGAPEAAPPAPFPIVLPRRTRPPLVTDGGRHGARAWAEHVLAWHLMACADDVAPDRAAAIAAQREALTDALAWCFRLALEGERALLALDGAARLEVRDDKALAAATAVDELVALIADARLAARWARPEVRNAAIVELAHHLRTAVLVERLWWVDEHPQSNAGAAWRARHHPERVPA